MHSHCSIIIAFVSTLLILSDKVILCGAGPRLREIQRSNSLEVVLKGTGESRLAMVERSLVDPVEDDRYTSTFVLKIAHLLLARGIGLHDYTSAQLTLRRVSDATRKLVWSVSSTFGLGDSDDSPAIAFENPWENKGELNWKLVLRK